MISFECDYNNGAHPKVLEHLTEHNGARPTPYGFDEYSERNEAVKILKIMGYDPSRANAI